MAATAAAAAGGVGKWLGLLNLLKSVGSGIGKFYSDHADSINDGVRSYAAMKAMNNPETAKGAMAFLRATAGGGGGGIGPNGFFPNGASVETDEMQESHPKGDNGVYKFKITGFSSSPFIKLKR